MQLSILACLDRGYEIGEYGKLEYKIQNNRQGEFSKTKDVGERLYRLGGYLSSYGSKRSNYYLYQARKCYNTFSTSKKTDIDSTDYFSCLCALLALLLMQIKQDIYGTKDYNWLEDELNWLKIRLPIKLFERYENQITVALLEQTEKIESQYMIELKEPSNPPIVGQME